MRILLATASLDDIRWATDNGLADGVTTTPSMLADAASEGDARDLLAEICRVTGMPVSVGVGAIDAADIYRDGRELAKLSENIVVEIPLMEGRWVERVEQLLRSAKSDLDGRRAPGDRLWHGLPRLDIHHGPSPS